MEMLVLGGLFPAPLPDVRVTLEPPPGCPTPPWCGGKAELSCNQCRRALVAVERNTNPAGFAASFSISFWCCSFKSNT